MVNEKNPNTNNQNSNNNAVISEQLTTENIVKNLDLIIAKPDQKTDREIEIEKLEKTLDLRKALPQTSGNQIINKNLEEKLRELKEKDLTAKIKGNQLYHMKESERKELAKNFTGLDRILFDRLNEKVGTIQRSTGGVALTSTIDTIVRAIPIYGNIAQIPATINDNNTIDNQRIQLEKRFDVNEVREIVKENQRELSKEIETAKKIIVGTLEEKDKEIGNLIKMNEDIAEEETKKLEAKQAQINDKDNEIQELRNQLTAQEETTSNFQVKIERLDEELTQVWNMKDEYQLKWDVTQEKLVRRREIAGQLMKQIDEEREIHQDAMKTMDKWYQRFINQELGNELLQTLKERQFLAQKNQDLENNIELIQQLSENQLIQNLTLVKNYQEKRAKMKEAKNKAKDKLKSEIHRFYLRTLFNTKEQLIRLEGTMKIIRSPSEKQLLEVKKNLSEILTEEEITTLCQLKVELTKSEIQLENLLVEKLEANVICLPLSTYKK